MGMIVNIGCYRGIQECITMVLYAFIGIGPTVDFLIVVRELIWQRAPYFVHILCTFVHPLNLC